ncbi:MAG: c-type cytochrome, partial [Pirellulaceae bacterium]|nr:c-type cytochrome [Pirellulaceae bacterium]
MSTWFQIFCRSWAWAAVFAFSICICPVDVIIAAFPWTENDDTLENTLKAQPVAELAQRVLREGDPARGSLLFHNPELTCIGCHQPAKESGVRLGPSIAEINNDMSITSLIDSLLEPSKQISEGFQSETLVTSEGKLVTGLVVSEDTNDDGFITLADPNQDGLQTRVALADIDERKTNKLSAMPDGLVGALPDEQSFLDLVRYLFEIKQGGVKTELALRPPASFFALEPLPKYEALIDHAALIRELDDESLERGQALYTRYCARCHGSQEQEGSMPSALKFAEGTFKNGNDPYAMYQTLTHGYGLMVAQRWMVPRQKYDVIHYIREQFLQPSNPNQHHAVTDSWLAGLPAGTERGPDPVDQTPWSDMDYGNFLFNTYEVGDDATNMAYKGIAIRLDKGPGGVSQGKQWVLYEHDTMRVAGIWSEPGFIDYNGIHFNDRHGVHPRIIGDLQISNDHRPGWANPQTDSFTDDPRIVGRDDRRYGPLPANWLKYRGLYQFDDRVILNYTVGDTAILESPSLQYVADQPVVQRSLNLSSRPRPLLLKVASAEGLGQPEIHQATALMGAPRVDRVPSNFSFDGSSYLQSEHAYDWSKDLTVFARIKTEQGGTILSQTEDGTDWVPGGTSLFIRDGKLVFDVGWVGDVVSRQPLSDNQWHDVALVWEPEDDRVRLYIDGELDKNAQLESGKPYENPVVRIGYTAENFPQPSAFEGEISDVKIWNRALTEKEIAALNAAAVNLDAVGDWFLKENTEPGIVSDRSRHDHSMVWQGLKRSPQSRVKNTWAVVKGLPDPTWQVEDGSLCLRIPAGETPLKIAIFTGTDENRAVANSHMQQTSEEVADQPLVNLTSMTQGGSPQYPDVLESQIETMPVAKTDAFAVDFLNRPEDNPWSCRMRLTGIDFVNQDEALISAWDGSVWRVTGFATGKTMQWKRVAHGMFQPLGIRIHDGQVFVTCRDQVVRLQDLNDDGYFDYYESFNSDHQVTEHFHEFAMGLQSDAAGNLYYAKSARHALPALVPHHGTLLKVSADGEQTEIIANGFRAANGVCLNPDGSFFVTDQEGHWTPKNRINWVQGNGGFYGNMFGYHDVEDTSDNAMLQPLCWITNQFDRSPGELLWVPKDAWGPLGGSLLNLSYGMGQIFV